MNYLPIAINLKNKRVIVVGGGKVAQRKIKTLLDTEALIVVIAPEITSKIRLLIEKGVVNWESRRVQESDIKEARLIVAATDSEEVNRDISRWAKQSRILVNVVDRQLISDFISPALLQQHKVFVAVYTDGRDPVLSRDLKNYLKENWDDFLSYRDRSEKDKIRGSGSSLEEAKFNNSFLAEP